MIKRLAILVAAVAAVAAASLPAQNLLTNGDFSQLDTNGNPKGWTIQKFDFKPTVVKFDTAGLGADNAICATHGKALNSTGNGIGEVIQANVLILQGTTHELRADVAIAGGFNNDPGKFEFFVDGVSVGAVDFTTSRGSFPGGSAVFRERIAIQFVPKTTGNKQVEIEISRKFLGSPNRTPLAYLDNVYPGRHIGPTLSFRGERKAGTTIQVDVVGRANNAFAYFGALSLLPKPVAIPGWTGQFALGVPAVFVLMGKTDATGKYSLKFPTPSGAVKLYLQGGQANGGLIDLGVAQLVNLY